MLRALWPAADVAAVLGFLVLCGLGKLTATEATAAVLAVLAGRLVPPKHASRDDDSGDGDRPSRPRRLRTGVRSGGVQTLLGVFPWFLRLVLPLRASRPTPPATPAHDSSPALRPSSYPSSRV